MADFKVLVTDTTWESLEREAAILAEAGASLYLAETGEEQELIELAQDADAILTCFATVTPAVVRAGSKLKVIGRYGIGVDNIAVAEATELGIPVTNVPAYCLDEVTEHVLGMLFTMARRLHMYDRAVRTEDWSLAVGAPIHRIAGSTLGVVGFGKIGRTIAHRAQGIGLRVVAYDPRAPDSAFSQSGVERLELLELASRADFVTLHVPATPETEGLIDAKVLAAMKPTAYLINTARGTIVDQDALAIALNAGFLAGAGLDVFVPEQLPADHPLMVCERVLATPHVAFYSEESLAELAALAATNVAEVLRGGQPAQTINPQVYERAALR